LAPNLDGNLLARKVDFIFSFVTNKTYFDLFVTNEKGGA
jgi:hypothetical protein